MPGRNDTRKAKIARILAERPDAIVDEPWMTQIVAALQPVTTRYVRELLRASGRRLTPLVAGVDQSSFDCLESSLLALADEYAAAPTREAARRVRTLVIDDKDRAKFVVARTTSAAIRETKREMILWLSTWLENPALFRDWVALRRRAQPLR